MEVTSLFFFLGPSGPAKGHKCIVTSNSPDKRPIDVACTFGVLGVRSRNINCLKEHKQEGLASCASMKYQMSAYSAVLGAAKATSSCQGYHCRLELDPVAVSNSGISFVGCNRHERERELCGTVKATHIGQNNLVLNISADYRHRPRKGRRHAKHDTGS